MSDKYNPKDDLKEYKGLSEDDKEWLKEFYNESYENGTYFKPPHKRIMKDKETIKELNRYYNNKKTDAFHNATPIEYNPDSEFMEEVADDNDWRLAYKQGGYELAVDAVIKQAIRDINDDIGDEITLVRFYIKMDNLRRLRNYEKRHIKNGK